MVIFQTVQGKTPPGTIHSDFTVNGDPEICAMSSLGVASLE